MCGILVHKLPACPFELRLKVFSPFNLFTVGSNLGKIETNLPDYGNLWLGGTKKTHSESGPLCRRGAVARP